MKKIEIVKCNQICHFQGGRKRQWISYSWRELCRRIVWFRMWQSNSCKVSDALSPLLTNSHSISLHLSLSSSPSLFPHILFPPSHLTSSARPFFLSHLSPNISKFFFSILTLLGYSFFAILFQTSPAWHTPLSCSVCSSYNTTWRLENRLL